MPSDAQVLPVTRIENPPLERLRAIVFADDQLIQVGIETMLADERIIAVTTANGVGEYDVAVVVARSVDDDTITRLARITSRSTAPILLVTGPARASTLRDLAAARIHSILSRDSLVGTTLADTVVNALKADDVLERYDLAQRVERLQAQHPFTDENQESHDVLAAQEVAVLSLLAEGMATKEVAARLSCSATSVNNTIQRMLSRLDLMNRVQAVAYAVRIGAI
ncbi:LuxR C-terminal-related transcriptional regulator [Lentzea sp. NPDC004782]|uniref:helix-turn-helix transcriptional regulator n=1 Tax=Lentzea sp. NPDC004782 TaxID=3154458 RepID=UPI0033A862CB